MTSTAYPPSRDPLTALVRRLPIIGSRPEDRATSEPEERPAETVVQIGGDVRLVRRPGEFYYALVLVGQEVLPHLLDVGLGRLVWTLATAAPTASCERARRVLAEAGIVATDPTVPKC